WHNRRPRDCDGAIPSVDRSCGASPRLRARRAGAVARMKRSTCMDADDLLSRPISRRALVTGMGVGGIALVLGGIGVVGARTARPSQIATAQLHGHPLDPPGTVVYTYHGHHSGVNTAVWSPSSARVASGASDKTVQIWGATTGNDVLVYRQHVGA